MTLISTFQSAQTVADPGTTTTAPSPRLEDATVPACSLQIHSNSWPVSSSTSSP
jgi:hypothetical protein